MGALAGSACARTALRHGVTAFAILLFMLALRSSGERVGRIAERLEIKEKTKAIQRRMLEAAARRPRDRTELVEVRLSQPIRGVCLLVCLGAIVWLTRD